MSDRELSLTAAQAEVLEPLVQQARAAEQNLRGALTLVGVKPGEALVGCDLTKGDESFLKLRGEEE